MTVARILLAIAVLAVTVGTARAQVYIGGDVPRGGAVEVSGGGLFAPGFDLDAHDAELTSSGDTPYQLFAVDAETGGFTGLWGRIGVFITRAISIEGGIRYARPELRYRLTDDVENAADETASERINHYVFDGSVLFHFTGASFGGGRGLPFISGGGGYVRELHEGNELAETGSEVHVTGGIKYWFGSGRHRLGLRAEGGVSSRKDGIDTGGERRTQPIVFGGVSYLF